MEEAVRVIVLGFSALAAGVALYSALVHYRQWHHHRREADGWLVLVNVGTAGIVLLIGQIVFAAEGIPLSLQAVAYGVCLVLISSGLIGLAHAQHQERGQNHRST